MTKWKTLEQIPQLLDWIDTLKCKGLTAATFGYAGVPTHIHFHLCPEEARCFFGEFKALIPSTITTVSFSYKGYAK